MFIVGKRFFSKTLSKLDIKTIAPLFVIHISSEKVTKPNIMLSKVIKLPIVLVLNENFQQDVPISTQTLCVPTNSSPKVFNKQANLRKTKNLGTTAFNSAIQMYRYILI